jgi:hypothetical protein
MPTSRFRRQLCRKIGKMNLKNRVLKHQLDRCLGWDRTEEPFGVEQEHYVIKDWYVYLNTLLKNNREISLGGPHSPTFVYSRGVLNHSLKSSTMDERWGVRRPYKVAQVD